ncbi:MAG: hypothetical protein DWQ09_07115 [Proteobacteria bacterium]|nr:MAG: hypothetical protein DWQ09_07115 [Pseudomonadota bacterium]QKK10492.1 MAG: hypothetical protein HND59_01590 [Pseudomonadota bacterium]
MESIGDIQMKRRAVRGWIWLLVPCFLMVAEPSFAWRMEAGTVALPATGVGSGFQTVTLRQSYPAAPVVVLLPTNENPGGQPAALRVRNVTTTSFEVVQVEPTGADGPHPAMTVPYIAVQPGIHQLPDGNWIQAGIHSTVSVQHGSGVSGGEGWDSVGFAAPFGGTPATLVQIQTMANEVGSPPSGVSVPWLTATHRSVTATGMEVALERSEVNSGSVSVAESVGWIAIAGALNSSFTDSVGATINYETRVVGNSIGGWSNGCYTTSFVGSYAAAPIVIASKNTHNGGDGGWLRRCSLNAAAAGFTVDEDQARDSERSHTTEGAGIAVFSTAFDADFPDPPPASTDAAWQLEAGVVNLPSTAASPNFTSANFTQPFSSIPLVFVVATNQGSDPSSVRVRNITTTGFELAQVEPTGNDGPHIGMEVHYVAVTPGTHRLPDGTVLEAGRVTTQAVQHGNGVSGAESWQSVAFGTPFAGTPTALAQIQTMNNEAATPPGSPSVPWLTAAQQSVSPIGLQVALERSEVAAGSVTLAEAIGWLAIQSGIQGSFEDVTGSTIDYETITSNQNIRGWNNGCYSVPFVGTYTVSPLVVAHAITHNGGDGGWLRRCSLSTTAVGLTVDEDIYRDSERNHTTERAGILVFSGPFHASIGLLGEWRFDEAGWLGAAGEVRDSTGRGSHGQSYGGAATASFSPVAAGSPGTCRYGVFDGVDDYVEIPHSAVLNGSDTLSYAAWVNPDSWSGVRQVMAKSVHGGGSGRAQMGIFSEGGVLKGRAETVAGRYEVSASLIYAPLGSWSHVVLTFSGDSLRLYVNGVERAATTFAATTLVQTTDPLAISKRVGSSQYFFDGLIDEVRVYANALTPTQVLEAMNARHLCPVSNVDHFDINIGSGSASTCVPQVITITAEDAGGSPVTSYPGVVTLSTSSSHGDWSVTSAAGVLNNGVADDGAATYGFAAGDNGSIVLDLANVHADDLRITVTDSGTGVTSTSALLSFRDNAFVITPTTCTGASCPGTGSTEVVAGRDHDFHVEFWRRDAAVSPSCGIETGYAGNTDLKVWRTDDADHPVVAVAPTIGVATLPNALPGANNLTLSFTAGEADFTLTTTDVGKYAVSLRDDTSGFAVDDLGNPRPIDGSTATLTVRPFAATVVNAQAGATVNPGVDIPGGAIFTAAGTSFQATVRGVRWQGVDDAGNDGVPDPGADLGNNSTTAAYAWNTTLDAGAALSLPYEPAAGVMGTLTRAGAGPVSVGAGEFAGGAAAPIDLQYGEVGSFTMGVAASDFLNTVGVNLTGWSGVIGRFTPFDFSVSSNAPEFATQCAAGSFTYVGQVFNYTTQPVLNVTARNALGATTQNYTGTWFRMTDASLTNKLYSALTGTLDVAGLPVPDPVIVDLGSGNATLTFAAGAGLAFQRGAPLAPFDAEIALSIDVRDADAVIYDPAAANNGNYSVGSATAGGGIAFDNGKAMRWGRVVLRNAFGSELVALPVPLAIEYWEDIDPTPATVYSFVTHTADTCTSLVAGDFSLPPLSFTGNLGVGDTTVTGVTLAAGSGFVTLAAPGSGNDGGVDVVGNTPGHLDYDWDGDGNHDNDPVGRATFGIYSGPPRRIYLREVY